VLLGLAVLAAGGPSLAAEPRPGSKLPPDDNACEQCHTEADLWEKDRLRLYISKDQLAEDVHWREGVNCSDCHGGDPGVFDPAALHASGDGFRKLADVKNACSDCHEDQAAELAKDVHARAGARDARGRGTPLDCAKCHSDVAHGLFPVQDSRSAVYLDHQVRTCGECHPQDQDTYTDTVHGQGLYRSGLLVVAVCADCHGTHGIYYAADPRSSLHPTNVADTCGTCHAFIEQRLLASVHGRGAGPGQRSEVHEPGILTVRKPACTSCHQGHHLLHPESQTFHFRLVNRCGNCHPDHSGRYAMSMHGVLTRMGYAPAANCGDCHGSHDILPVDDPRSQLAPGENRLETCKKCHVYATLNFTTFDPHANYKDRRRYPFLFSTYHDTQNLILLLFGVFLIHALLWFLRSLLHTLQYGRHKTLATEQTVLIRAESIHRWLAAVLIISFLGLTLTGLPLRYGSQDWATSLARGLGGFESTSVWHRFFAVLALVGCGTHLAWGLSRIVKLRRQAVAWREMLFGPDSPVPGPRDAKDMVGMVNWFLGLGERPVFELGRLLRIAALVSQSLLPCVAG
jgi:hypothetical protein